MPIVFALPLLMFLLPNLAMAKPLGESDHWRKSKLTREFLSRFISNEKCLSGAEYLRSCRAALRAAAQLAGVTQPDEQADTVLEFDQALADLEASLDRTLPVQMLRAAAINAHLAVFDPHAALIPSTLFEQNLSGEKRSYAGVGVMLEMDGPQLLIREVAAGSPAHKAGVREDDILLAVAQNGQSFENVNASLERAAELILGHHNSSLSLRLRRGRVQLDLPMKRAVVQVPFVTSNFHEGTGYLRVLSFESYAVCSLVITHLNRLQAKNIKQLILDLRGNPGGEKAMSICVAELFLGPLPVVGSKSLQNIIPALLEVMPSAVKEISENEIIWEGGYVASPKYSGPLVVLIDGLSASGSELVAGALQDHQRAWLVGERSFGKGTVQSLEFVPNFPSLTLKWTSEHFYQPSGRSNQTVGVSPDFAVNRRKGRPPELALERRPLEAGRISACIENTQAADQNLGTLVARGETPDYQKAFALAVLGCL